MGGVRWHYVSIRQHASAYISIRQHTSAGVLALQFLIFKDEELYSKSGKGEAERDRNRKKQTEGDCARTHTLTHTHAHTHTEDTHENRISFLNTEVCVAFGVSFGYSEPIAICVSSALRTAPALLQASLHLVQPFHSAAARVC